MITMLRAREDDARELAPLLRSEDRAEVLALGVDPFHGLLQSVAASRKAWTYRDDAQIVCMAGVAPLSLIGSTGLPWLPGSPLVAARRRAFMVETRRMLAHWLTMFDVLRNVVDAQYEAAVRWLRWLGFKVGKPFRLANGQFRVVHKRQHERLLSSQHLCRRPNFAARMGARCARPDRAQHDHGFGQSSRAAELAGTGCGRKRRSAPIPSAGRHLEPADDAPAGR